jgi:hypothetical protein
MRIATLQERLDEYLQLTNEEVLCLAPQEIAKLFQASPRIKKRLGFDLLKSELSRLVAAVETVATRKWRSKEVTALLSGLKSLELNSQLTSARPLAALRHKMTAAIRSTSLSVTEIATSLSGLERLNDGSTSVRALVSILADKVRESRAEFGAQQVGSALFGLQNCSTDSIEVRSLLAALAAKVHDCREEFSAQQVTNSLTGLRNCKTDSAEVRSLLAALAVKIRDCREELNAQHISECLASLQNCSSEHVEVRSVLDAIHVKGILLYFAVYISTHAFTIGRLNAAGERAMCILIHAYFLVRGCRERLSAQQLGNGILGLQCCCSDNTETRSVLAALVVKVRRCRDGLLAQHAGDALLGLRGCSSDVVEVRSVLAAVAVKLQESRAELSATQLCKALAGLQSCSSDAVEVCAVLAALTTKVQRMGRAGLSGEQVGALAGLRRCSSNSTEVRALLAALADKVRESRAEFGAQEVGSAFRGLQNCSTDSIEVRSLLAALAAKRAHRPDAEALYRPRKALSEWLNWFIAAVFSVLGTVEKTPPRAMIAVVRGNWVK